MTYADVNPADNALFPQPFISIHADLMLSLG